LLMLTALKQFIRFILPSALYGVAIFAALGTIFKKAEWGLYLMIVMIPQPNIWHKLHEYPMGKDFMDILIFSILLGILYQQKGFDKTSNTTVIILVIIVSYLALWNSSLRFNLLLPFTTSNELLKDWKNYAEMILLYFLVLNVVKKEEQQKILVTVMSIVILLIAIRSYRNFSGGDSFSYDKRVGGPFEAVGLGANHFGSFIAFYCSAFLGMFFYDKDKKRKLLYLSTYIFGLHPLFFSYSRGAYLASLGALAIMGFIKKRALLLVVVLILVSWQFILPASVVDRINMTHTSEGEIEGSAGHRLILWEHATLLFRENPVFGVGFGGFGFTVPEGELLTDTHNFYMKTLSEQGIVGMILLLVIFYKAFLSGWRLLSIGKTPFHEGLGLGFIGCVVAVMIANIFGDRWSYFVLGSYFWIFWGIVDRGILISQSVKLNHADTTSY
jgi:O-antigen ligase